MPPSLHLWISPSSCSLVSHILLREAKLPITLTKLDLKNTNGFPEEHKHVNPKRKVPILIIDSSETVTENIAIITYISSLVPDRFLLGKTPLEIARSYEWFSYISSTLHSQAYGGFFRPARFSDDVSTHDGIRARSRGSIRECYEFIEGKLDGDHAVGNEFTAADVYLFVLYRWGNAFGFEMEKNYPKYTKLAKGVLARESVGEAMAEEGIVGLGEA